MILELCESSVNITKKSENRVCRTLMPRGIRMAAASFFTLPGYLPHPTPAVASSAGHVR